MENIPRIGWKPAKGDTSHALSKLDPLWQNVLGTVQYNTKFSIVGDTTSITLAMNSNLPTLSHD